MKTSSHLLFAVALCGASFATAADWTHVMGPTFNRKSAETAPAPEKSRPNGRKLWTVPAHGGFSSFVTGDGRAYTIDVAGGVEAVVAMNRADGKKLWEYRMSRAEYRGGGERNGGEDGPRSTPAFSKGRVFVFGGEFDLHALDAATGKLLWKHNLMQEFGGQQIVWSNAQSPLVLEDRVIVSGGGSGQSYLAFRPDNGEVIWKSGSDRPTHSTPVLTTIHGQTQVLFMAPRGLVSLDPKDGKELWHYPFSHQTSTAASPVVWQDIVNVSAAYGVGGGACQVTRTGDKWEVTELWRSRGNRDTAAHWSTAVAHDGHLYGMYGHASETFGHGPFKCIDIRTGVVKWSQSGFGPSQVIMAGNRLVATTDSGKLVLIDPSPAGYKEVARLDGVDGKVWSTPAFSDGQVLLRSTSQGVCLEM